MSKIYYALFNFIGYTLCSLRIFFTLLSIPCTTLTLLIILGMLIHFQVVGVASSTYEDLKPIDQILEDAANAAKDRLGAPTSRDILGRKYNFMIWCWKFLIMYESLVFCFTIFGVI